MAATHPLKERSQALLRKHGISLKNLYKDSKDIESDEQDVMVKEIADGYLLVFSEEEPPIAEVKVEDLDDYVDDPSDYFGGLGVEIISIQEKGIVGTCSCRIYYFSEMAGLFSANYILTRLDDECVDKAAVGLELKRRKQFFRYPVKRSGFPNCHPVDRVVRFEESNDPRATQSCTNRVSASPLRPVPSL